MRAVILAICFLCLAGCGKNDAYNSRGKWLVVNYWASWCVPCLKELPELNHFYLKHKERVVVLGVSFDQWSPERIKRFASKHHIAFPMVGHFPKEKYGLTHIPTVPVTLLITPQGKLKTVLHGPQDMTALEKMMALKAITR